MSTNDLKNVVRYGWDELQQEEALVDSTSLVAGHLVESTTDGYQPHSTDGGGVNRPVFAKDMRGRGYEAGDSYPDNEYITFIIPNAGVGLTGILAAGADLATAANADIEEDEELVSAGDGTLRAIDADDENAVVAVAKEAKDNSGAAAGETALLDIEVTR